MNAHKVPPFYMDEQTRQSLLVEGRKLRERMRLRRLAREAAAIVHGPGEVRAPDGFVVVRRVGERDPLLDHITSADDPAANAAPDGPQGSKGGEHKP